jgi:hypothetical protein
LVDQNDYIFTIAMQLYYTSPPQSSLASISTDEGPAVALLWSAVDSQADRMGIEYSTEDHQDIPCTGRNLYSVQMKIRFFSNLEK